MSKFAYVLLLGVLLCIVAPSLWGDGMFMDGVIYASIARNMSEGQGWFWAPHFSQTMDNTFYGHLPLGLFLQSLWFGLWGDAWHAERSYSLLMFLLSVWLMRALWKQAASVLPQNQQEWATQVSFLPFLLLLTAPLSTWTMANNLLENTVQFFVLLSVWGAWQAVLRQSGWWALAGGGAIFAAVLSKGITGAFGLSALFWIWLLGGKSILPFKQFLLYTSLSLLGLLLPFIILYFFDAAAWHYIQTYTQVQLVGSLQGIVTVDSRGFIVWRIAQELIPMGIVALLGIVGGGGRVRHTEGATAGSGAQHRGDSRARSTPTATIGAGTPKKLAWIFACIALSGILPLMISHKQSGFYAAPALPFFALSVGFLVFAWVHKAMNWIHQKARIALILLSILVLAIGISLSIYSSQHWGRDQAKLHDIRQACAAVGKAQTIGIQDEIRFDWSLIGYFQRYGHISIDLLHTQPRAYLWARKDKTSVDTSVYRDLQLEMQEYALYKQVSE